MRAELYSGAGDFYQYTNEQVTEFTNGVVGPFPVVVSDDDQIIAMQPWHPDTEQAWLSDDDALAWGARWIEAANTPRVSQSSARQSAEEKLVALGLTEEEVQAIIRGR